MMVKILGLPPNVKNYDIKTLIKKECNISEIILDEFVDNENGSKNVKVGLASDEEGYRVITCLNGFRFSNQYIIKVEQVGKSTSSKPKTYPIPTVGSQSYHYQQRESTTQNTEYQSQYGNHEFESHSDIYRSGDYGTGSESRQLNQPRQFGQQTDKYGSASYGNNQATHQINQPQRQWGTENPSQPPKPDPYSLTNKTNRRNRSPEQEEALSRSFLTKLLNNIKNPQPLHERETQSRSPFIEDSSIGRNSSQQYHNERVSPRGWKPESKPMQMSDRFKPSGRPVSPDRSKPWESPAWAAPHKHPSAGPSIPSKQSQLNLEQFSSARMSGYRADDSRTSGHHESSMSQPSRYVSVDNKSSRYGQSYRSDKCEEKHITNNQKDTRPTFQTQESNRPTYSSGYSHSQKGSSSYSALPPIHQTPWQHDVKNNPDLNKFESKQVPMRMRVPTRSPIREERSSSHEAGRTSPRRSWSNETRPKTFDRPPPFVWDKPNKSQSTTAWNSTAFQENTKKYTENSSQNFDNTRTGSRVESLERNRPPDKPFTSHSREPHPMPRVASPPRNTYRPPIESNRNPSEHYRPQQFERPPPSLHRDRETTQQHKDRRIEEMRITPHESNRSEDSRSRHQESQKSQYDKYEREDPTGPAWNTDDIRGNSDPNLKRDRAAETIVSTIMQKHQYLIQCDDNERLRVMEELKFELGRLFVDMFGDRDISYIEIMIKYKAKFGDKDEEVLIENALSKLSIEMRCTKRSLIETTDVPVKVPRYSQESHSNTENIRPNLSSPNVPDWKLKSEPPMVVVPRPVAQQAPFQQPVCQPVQQQLPNPQMNVAPQLSAQINVSQQLAMAMMANQLNAVPNVMQNSIPSLMSNPVSSIISNTAPSVVHSAAPNVVPSVIPSLVPNVMSNTIPNVFPNMLSDAIPSLIPNVVTNMGVPYENSYLGITQSTVGFVLYLCKENSEAFTQIEADEIKKFLYTRIMRVTETSQGWSPDITFKGLQCPTRYELFTKDEITKKWLQKIDFTEITCCNVLLYTPEELCYERAAIWLPGHSKKNTLDPFEKLKLQNKKLDDVHINKWKVVKKIVTVKGTRLYVDMMPTAACALQYYKMRLSYELQKVDVFLRSAAVDKDAFDAGMKEISLTDRNEIMKAARSTNMPTIANGFSVVKITISDLKFLTPLQAHKIKEIVIYHIFRYHQHGGTSSTDFLKYGFISPNLVGIVPENEQSKRWLLDHQFGQLHSAKIIVLGAASRKNIKHITMYVTVNTAKAKTDRRSILDTIKKSNIGIEGLHFHLWEPQEVQYTNDKKTAKLYIDIDIKSIETLMCMNNRLDYVECKKKQSIYVKTEYSTDKFMELLKQKKSQIDDSSVIDMEFSSEEDDIIWLN